MLSNVLEYFDDRPGFLRNILRTAAPARLLIRVPMIDRNWRVPFRMELGLPYFSDLNHFTEYTEDSFRAEMEAVGLEITYSRVVWGTIWAEVRPVDGSSSNA